VGGDKGRGMASKKAKVKDSNQSSKNGFAPKDWVAVTISVLALIVSGGTAYFNVIQKVENVSVTVRYTPSVDKDGDKLAVRPETYSVFFINSGNRPVTIFGMSVLFVQHKERLAFNCYPETIEAAAGQFDTDLEPFVVKENEVAIKSFKIGARHPYGQQRVEGPDASSFLIIDELKQLKDIPIEICLDVELSTPTLKYYSQRVSLLKIDVADWGYFYGDDIAARTPNTPAILIDRKTTIFW
jgi:hypothetical protein